MYKLKAFCAGILVLQEEVSEESLKSRLAEIKAMLLEGELTITFAQVTQIATELCVDVYEKSTDKWRHNLSAAYKK